MAPDHLFALGSTAVPVLVCSAVVGVLVYAALRKGGGGHLHTAAPLENDAHEGPMQHQKVFLDPDMPVDASGRTYHLQTRAGEVASRILSVGDVGRAERIATLLTGVRCHPSTRGFATHTGTYKGVPVSIVATGMGTPMIDFVVRECRAVVATGPLAVLRFGTCGGLALYIHAMREGVGSVGGGKFAVRTGMDATADSFYSSQGRKGRSFLDVNEAVIPRLTAAHPALCTLQMETFHLLDLARCSTPSAPVHASAAAIVLVNRGTGSTVDKGDMQALEMAGGRAALEALAAFAM